MRVITIVLISAFTITLLHNAPIVSADLPEYIHDGPFIDSIVYRAYGSQDQRIMGLLSGEFEMDSTYLHTTYLDPTHLEYLNEDPDIDIAQTLRNGYGHISFHCDMFPTNISGFRRSFAYAFNKTQVTTDVMNGLSQTHDSLIPYLNPFCIEDDLDWHYYDSRPDLGNIILEDLGFTIDPTTGFRNAPNGDSFYIMILHVDNDQCRMIAELAVEAFELLHVNAVYSAPCNCDLHEQMVVFGQSFENFDLSWLVNQYWSESPNDPYTFSSGFINSTFDGWVDQLLYSSTYEETFEAAAEIQKILHYNVPRLVVSQDIQLHPYRTDRFERHIIDEVNSVAGPWTMLSIRPIDSTYGGLVTIGFSDYPNFNYVTSNSLSGNCFFKNMHYALYTKTPDQEPYPQLAQTVSIETHADNPSILTGHTRFTFDIRDDIEWTDGIPVTAEDVIFTFNYALETREFGNPMGDDLTELSALYSPAPNKVVLEFSTESYWHFDRLAFEYILPKHIFENFSLEEWRDWDLITTAEGNSLNCGPFMLTDFDDGEWYEFTARDPWVGNEDGVYVPSVTSIADVQVVFPYFTLHWEIEWNTTDTDSYTIDERRFDMASTPRIPSLRFTVLLDGEVHSVEEWDQITYLIEGIDVSFGESTLTPGQHNVTLLLEADYQLVQIDTVMVTVILPTSILGLTIGLSGTIIATTVLAILWNFRSRRSRPQHSVA